MDDWFIARLCVIEADTRPQAQSLCENDPYFKLGLRKGYRLYVWGKALLRSRHTRKVLSRICPSGHTRFSGLSQGNGTATSSYTLAP